MSCTYWEFSLDDASGFHSVKKTSSWACPRACGGGGGGSGWVESPPVDRPAPAAAFRWAGFEVTFSAVQIQTRN